MATQFHESFNTIKSTYEEVFKILDSAVHNEENEEIALAFENYKTGVTLIDQVLSTPISLPENIDCVKDEWDDACKMIHKLKKARAEVIQRIGILSEKLNANNLRDANKDDNNDWSIVTSENEPGRMRTYTELAQALRNLQSNPCSLNTLELIFSCDGVKLYHIKANGTVTTNLEDSILRVIRMEKDEEKSLKSTFFVQIIKSSKAVQIKNFEVTTENEILNSEENRNLPSTSFASTSSNNEKLIDNFDGQNDSSWIYPLIPGASPCFRTEYGAFIFPDLESSEPGTSFGVFVPKDDRNDEIFLEILEAILHGVVIQSSSAEDKSKAPPDFSHAMSSNIVRGAQYVSQSLITGAEKTGNLISSATPYLISKITGAPENAPPVSENVQTTVAVARNVTGVAASATGYIAGKIGSATMALGRFLAPHIEKHGSTLLSKGFGLKEEDSHKKMNEILTIAAGAVEGFGTVYSGLEESAKILGKNLGENSVKIIEHKYGPSAGNLAVSTFDTVGNMVNLSQNVGYFSSKGFAKKTAKNAGKGIIETYCKTKTTTNKVIPASSIYPNLSLLEAEIKKN